MRRLYILLFCILFVGLLVVKPCWSEWLEIDGYKWTSMDDSMKIGFALGFIWGVSRATEEGSFALRRLALRLMMPDLNKEVAPTIRELANSDADVLGKKLDLSGITAGQLIEGLDNFYKDYRNMKVLAEEAIWIVKLEIRGAPREFIDEEIRLLRMPEEEGAKEWLNLLEKNRTYKEASDKWRDQTPSHLHW